MYSPLIESFQKLLVGSINANIINKIKSRIAAGETTISTFLSPNSSMVLEMRGIMAKLTHVSLPPSQILFSRQKKFHIKEMGIENRSRSYVLTEFTKTIKKMLNLTPELNTTLNYDQIINFKGVFSDDIATLNYQSLSFKEAKDTLKNWCYDFVQHGCSPLIPGVIIRLGDWEFKKNRDQFIFYQNSLNQPLAQHHNISRHDLKRFVSMLTKAECKDIVIDCLDGVPDLEYNLKDHVFNKIRYFMGDAFSEDYEIAIYEGLETDLFSVVSPYDLLTIILQNIPANYVIGPRIIDGDTKENTMLVLAKDS